ncbi:long-chain fatty-acid-CoA ligase [Hyaloraphidium curvatum]|nr:long-chain fatty-acid-CoA ligase [Hyaloraphidium curvatum]
MAGLGLAPGQTPEAVTFRQLDELSNQLAHLFRSRGLKRGDAITIFMGNNAMYHPVAWAAQRSGLRFVCAPSKLSAEELRYMVEDSGSKLVVASPELRPVPDQLAVLLAGRPEIDLYMAFDADPKAPWKPLETERDRFPPTPIADQSAGQPMPYSSGSTGRPKGIHRLPPPGAPAEPPFDGINPSAVTGMRLFGFEPYKSVYISPGPLYHSSPIGWTMAVQSIGGTVVIMEKFDAEALLALIERYRCTTGHFVATHFVRLLKLPQAVRAKYDLSSLVKIFHSAAPTPADVKRAMIAWIGPKIQEFYGGSEGIGMCFVPCAEWLKYPGTCGKPVPPMKVHIWDEEADREITQPGVDGVVYFEGGSRFAYHNDPEKTASAANRLSWTTLGDIGHLNEDGYLFLTDRKAFMIISGGVNIYPQEIENSLVLHPKVADAAVVGAPDPDLGERTVAVVQPVKWDDAGEELARELDGYLRGKISRVKVPKEISFAKELPRQDTGKLFKKVIKDAYHGRADAKFKGVVPQRGAGAGSKL